MVVRNILLFLLLILGVLEARVASGSRGDRQTARSLGAAPRSHCGKTDSSPIGRVNTRHRLQELRSAMKKVDLVRGTSLDAYIITSDDEHQSEAVASRDQRRQFISGFSGSQGEAVVTSSAAALWTDARYYTQADNELACYWQLMRSGFPKVPTISEWLGLLLRNGSRVGADPRLIAYQVWITLESDLAKENITLVAVTSNLVDHVWTKNRPEYPKNTAFVQDFKYAGETWMIKVQRVRTALQAVGAHAQIVTALDEIAWLLNIRGRDTPFAPVVRSYLLLTLDGIDLYVPGGQSGLSERVLTHLRSVDCFTDYCVRIHGYEKIWTDLPTLSQRWNKVLVPSPFSYSQGASHAIYSKIPAEKRILRPSPIMLIKAVKNKAEIEGMRRAHIRDAAAICLFMSYMEEKLAEGDTWDELTVATTVDQFRFSQPLSEGASFRTIAGYGPNGALPHYRPRKNSSLPIKKDSTLVLDSGGQYEDGTTDVTRTFHFGEPTTLQKEAYTRVLAGQLNLARLIFPYNVDTADVDVLARSPLWLAGMDYRHSTGHGIGAYLAVHEPPISINYDSKYRKTFEVGHFFSDEPGFYLEGNFGIRLENILEVVNVNTRFNVSGPYLGFRSATLVPYEPKLINLDLLTPDLRRMLNEYNARVRVEVGPELKKKTDLKGFRWMMNKTGYIPEWIPPKSASLSIQPSLGPISILMLSVLRFT